MTSVQTKTVGVVRATVKPITLDGCNAFEVLLSLTARFIVWYD